MTRPFVFNTNYTPVCPTPDEHKHTWPAGCRRKRTPGVNYMEPWAVEDNWTSYHETFQDALWEAHIRATEPTA